MEAQTAIDMGRQAIWVTLMICSPVLVSGVIISLVIGLLQALTQIQDQTVAFVPKLVVMMLVLGLTLPWIVTRMLEYSGDLIGGIAGRL
jgi:flagellar biosynthetic protein FliQ